MRQSRLVAVITGAASGIGLALTKVCLARGMHVVMADINTSTLKVQYEDLLQSIDVNQKLYSFACDVTKAEDVKTFAKKTFAALPRVDWLFNNAGVSGTLAPIWKIEIAAIKQVLDVNLYGAIHIIQAFLPYLFKQQHRSRIINMASMYGLCSGSQLAPYAMSKHAIVALSESLYFDLQRLDKQVDVSVACPSFVNTGLLQSASTNNILQASLNKMLAHAKNPTDVANHIADEIEREIFYILPDKEVKNYNEEKAEAISGQQNPVPHSVEKLMKVLAERAI